MTIKYSYVQFTVHRSPIKVSHIQLTVHRIEKRVLNQTCDITHLIELISRVRVIMDTFLT